MTSARWERRFDPGRQGHGGPAGAGAIPAGWGAALTRVATLIVGGGLAGLALADLLARAGRDFLLVEAQDRFGGRILTHQVEGAGFDLGPTWFWPGQERIAALVRRLGLAAFAQHSSGAILLQTAGGAVERDRGYASMAGSLRVAGGLGAVIAGLVAGLPPARLRLHSPVTALENTGQGLRVHLGAESLLADRVVLALPPRLIAQRLRFAPVLPAQAMQALERIPTWMAGQAKILAVYDRPHWREAGLSGDAMSLRGPMAEVHDASPAQGGPYALFGFVGVPPATRAAQPDEVCALALRQLVEMFGPGMAAPRALVLQDWARNPSIATAQDQVPPRAHPDYGLPQALAGLWSGRLIFAATEMGQQFGGYLEGALEAAEAAWSLLRHPALPQAAP